jgi:microcin C transport system substrate-binding protein
MTNCPHHLTFAALAGATVLLAGCGKSTSGSAPPAPGTSAASSAAGPSPANGTFSMEADLAKTVKEQSDFYHMKTHADLVRETEGLKWEDGSDLPAFGDPAAKKGGTLSLRVPDFPGTFRTFGPDSSSSFREFLLDYVAAGLVWPHPNVPGRVYPWLATSWTVNRQTNTVYFRLDPDAVWSDGAPLTADDVLFDFYMFRSPFLNDPWINNFYHTTYTGLSVYDAHTFSLSFKEYHPDIISKAGDPFVAEPIFSRRFFKDFGPDWVSKYNWRISPTLGPYEMKEEDVKRMSSITLTHIKNWWGENKRFNRGRFNPDRIRLNVIRDEDKRFEAFFYGDLDLIDKITSAQWYSKLPDTQPTIASGFTVKTVFYNRIPTPMWGLWINEAIPPLGNLDVRLGIFYATDFDLVCKQYFRGAAVVQKTTSDGYGWDTGPGVEPRPYDPAKARAYFAKAGYTQEGPDGVLATADGRRLSLTITTTYRRFQDVLVILKQEALKAGLEYNIEVLDETTGWQKTQEKKHEITLAAFNRSIDMYPRYWDFFSGDNAYINPYLPDGSPNPARKIKESTNNLFSLADFPLDQMIKQYDKAGSMDETKALAAKMEKRISDDAVWVNGWNEPFLRIAYRPWVHWPKDFLPMQSLDAYEFWEMWIDQDEQKADLAALAEGKDLPRQVLIYDKYREP